MDRANDIFDQIDTDKSGGLDKGEITIHLLALGQEQETVMEMFALLDADNDGFISREEFVNGFQKYQEFCKLSTNNRSGKASSKAALPSFAALIDAGTVVPDEHDGPYALSSYHANVTGNFRGYKGKAGYDAWNATNKGSWRGRRAGPPSTLRPRTPSTPSTCSNTAPSTAGAWPCMSCARR